MDNWSYKYIFSHSAYNILNVATGNIDFEYNKKVFIDYKNFEYDIYDESFDISKLESAAAAFLIVKFAFYLICSLFMYFLIKKYLNSQIAIIGVFLFLTHPFMIYHATHLSIPEFSFFIPIIILYLFSIDFVNNDDALIMRLLVNRGTVSIVFWSRHGKQFNRFYKPICLPVRPPINPLTEGTYPDINCWIAQLFLWTTFSVQPRLTGSSGTCPAHAL